jgi:GNAT superfamily N-acetyltransferase
VRVRNESYRFGRTRSQNKVVNELLGIVSKLAEKDGWISEMTDYRIRQAGRNDLQAINALWCQLSVDQLSKDEYYQDDLEFAGNEGQIAEALASPECAIFVAEVDGVVVGFSEVWLYNRDFHFFIADYAYMLHLYVDTSVRKRSFIWGLVNALYRVCESWAVAHGQKYLVADIFSHNQRVMKFAARWGLKNYRSRFVKPLRQ